MNIKKKTFLLAAGAIMSTALPSAAVNTLIKGTLNDYPGKGYLLLISEGSDKYDTIDVKKDGSFAITVDIKENTSRSLYFEYLGDHRGLMNLYLIPGKPLTVDVKGGMQKMTFMGETRDVYKSQGTFKGASKKECEYLALSPFADYKYFGEDGKPVGFANFKQQIAAFMKDRTDKLKGTCAAFRAAVEPQINAIPDQFYIVYSRFLRNKGFDAYEDKDFKAFIDGIDVNDKSCYERGLTAAKVEFMSGRDNATYAKEPKAARYFCYLRDNVSNKEVCASLADKHMDYNLAVGDNDGLVRSFEVYTQCSGSGKAYEANKKVYESISKLLPGVAATDFTMQDVDGKSVQFRSVIGQGKVTFIDFWATWCGPCCAEIPYLEKLVEKYKDNPDIEFVSISLDNDLKKWQAKLAKDKPQWRQYVIPDNFNSEFATEYNIRAIPRFMAFDAEGKIITINAERPSSPDIDKALESYMKK